MELVLAPRVRDVVRSLETKALRAEPGPGIMANVPTITRRKA